MRRVELGHPGASRVRLLDAMGEPVVPDGGLVRVRLTSQRAGGLIVADDLAAVAGDRGWWSVGLPASAVAQLDRLTAQFRYTVAGEAWLKAELVEVCGGQVLGLEQAHSHNTLGKQPLHLIEQARASAESALEDRCGYAFVPRYERIGPLERTPSELLLYRPGGRRALLQVRRLIAVERGGVITGPGQVTVSQAGIARGLDRGGAAPVFLHVEHGLDAPPDEADHAVLLLAADHANTSRPRTTLRKGSADGSFEVFASQDRAGAGAFVIPEVEAFCVRNEARTVI